MFRSARAEEEESLLLSNDQLLDHSDSDDDEPENKEDLITKDDIQQIHTAGHSVSVEVRCRCLLFHSHISKMVQARIFVWIYQYINSWLNLHERFIFLYKSWRSKTM